LPQSRSPGRTNSPRRFTQISTGAEARSFPAAWRRSLRAGLEPETGAKAFQNPPEPRHLDMGSALPADGIRRSATPRKHGGISTSTKWITHTTGSKATRVWPDLVRLVECHSLKSEAERSDRRKRVSNARSESTSRTHPSGAAEPGESQVLRGLDSNEFAQRYPQASRSRKQPSRNAKALRPDRFVGFRRCHRNPRTVPPLRESDGWVEWSRGGVEGGAWMLARSGDTYNP